MNLYGRHFLTLRDFTASEIEYLLDLSAKLKEMKKKRIAHRYLEGYQIALLFEKTSTRTRCAFEVAAHDLGMDCTYLDPASSQMGKKKALPIRPEFWGVCLTGLSTVVLNRLR